MTDHAACVLAATLTRSGVWNETIVAVKVIRCQANNPKSRRPSYAASNSDASCQLAPSSLHEPGSPLAGAAGAMLEGDVVSQ